MIICNCLHFKEIENDKYANLLRCIDCGSLKICPPSVWAWVARSGGKWRCKR